MSTKQKLPYYRLPASEVLEQLKTSTKGLTTKEALKRLQQSGGNTLVRTKHELPAITFLRQFRNFLVILLLISTAFSIYLRDIKTASILLGIALMNAFVGYSQEHKAETLMQSLEQLLVPKAKAMRGGHLQEIEASELVVGDVVYIEEGDSVPADLRLIDEEEIATNDFALTGESNPSRKFVHAIGDDVPLGNRGNLLFMGTTVAIGSGHGVVVGVGMQTELGRIASLSQATRTEASPLQKEMNLVSSQIAKGTIVLSIILIFIALRSHLDLHDAVLFGIGIGAAMIPSGLVAEVNITLAQAASRLAKARALVKKLSSVETLGATNFILTDKTGTLTKNEMTVEQLLIGRDIYDVTGTGYETNGQVLNKRGKSIQDAELFFITAALASNAKVNPPDEEHPDWYVVGDPTEGALITLVRKAGIDIDAQELSIPELKEYQFDSARKLLSSVRRRDGQLVVFTKGAPEQVLAKSTEIWDHGHIRKISPKDKQRYSDYNETQAKNAKRNLALAYRVLPKDTELKDLTMESVEQNFTFLGMLSMVDPLREDVAKAMRAACGAHIKVSIITGDYPTTAKAIARQANLADDITIVLGSELPSLSDAQILQYVARGGAVFSRVAPEDKLRIVEIVKQSGHVVAVTGDGINDAPALKRADIGVAMGRTGTDVAKDAAGIVLLDDSFNTLISAVEQGRLTFLNISKAARCALTDNAGELAVILISLAGTLWFHVPAATTAIQILAVDVIAQIFPITALGWDKAQKRLMREKPRQLENHIVNKHSLQEFAIFGLLTAVLAYANFILFFERRGLSAAFIDKTSEIYFQATMITYLTIVLCQFVNIMFVRANEHEKFFTSYLWSNKKLLFAFGVSFFCIANVMYNPWIQPYFGAGPLSFSDWCMAVLAAVIYMSARLIQRHTRLHTRHAVIALHHEIHD